MFATFPELLFLAPLSAALLRVSLAILFGQAAWTHIRGARGLLTGLGILEALVALALFAGFQTQPAALAAFAVCGVWMFMKGSRAFALSTILLALIIALSLVMTGPGPFAFDLPL